jgi:hypothetical protein
MANNIQVKDAAGATKTLVTKEISTDVHRPIHEILGYDATSDMLKVGSTTKVFRDCFPGTTLDATAWDSAVGTGGSVTVNNNVVLSSGTTASAETAITTDVAFRVPCRVQVGLTLTQRIANQSFFVELISVDPVTLVPDGLNVAAILFDGTNVSGVKNRGQFKGGTATDVTYATGATSTARKHEIELRREEVWFHNTDAVNGTGGRSNSSRRDVVVPDPNAVYKLRLRWVNGVTPPASSTDATVTFVLIVEGTEIDAQILGGRGTLTAGHALPSYVTNSSFDIAGMISHDSALGTIKPVHVGGRGRTALFTTPAQDDAIALTQSIGGQLIVSKFAPPEATWSYAAASGGITNTTDVEAKAAAGAGLRNYVTGLQLRGASATATEFVIKDGATVLWRGHLGASATITGYQCTFDPPLRGTANTALNIACVTTGTQTYANLQGYVGP